MTNPFEEMKLVLAKPETFTREEVSEWLERKLVEQGTFFKQVVNKEASQVLEELIAEIGGNNE